MSEKKIEALEMLARDLLEEEIGATALERTTVAVRYFGRGQRFQLQRANGKIDAIFYIHKDSSARLPELVKEAAQEIHAMLQKKVAVRKELLRRIVAVADDLQEFLTEEESTELQDLLKD